MRCGRRSEVTVLPQDSDTPQAAAGYLSSNDSQLNCRMRFAGEREEYFCNL